MRSKLFLLPLFLTALTMSGARAGEEVVLAGAEAAIEESTSYAEEMVAELPVETRTPPPARRWENAEELIDVAMMRSAHKERLTRTDVRSTELFKGVRLATTMLLMEQVTNNGSGEESHEREAEVRFGAELHWVRVQQSDP